MVKGGCHCGQVELRVAEVLPPGLHCHCTLCRRLSGAAFSSWVQVPRGALRVNANSSALASYNSSASCSRWYCSRCHAPLYADEAGRPDLPLFVCAGVLDETALAKLPFEDMYTENCATWFSRGEKLVAHRAGYFDRET